MCETQAKELIKISNRAPFGRGEQTIVDTSVRCTWQLNPSQFSINNPNWEKSLNTLSSKLRTELGCSERMTVTYELYKMLLYEPGGFFKVCNMHTVMHAVICDDEIACGLSILYPSPLNSVNSFVGFSCWQKNHSSILVLH